MDQEIQRSFRLDGLAMLVDARLLSLYTGGRPGGHEQIAFANVLIVNKTDMVSPGEVAEMERWLRGGQQHRAHPQHQLRQPPLEQLLNIGRHAIDRALGRGTRPSDARLPAQQRPSAARIAAVVGRAADGEGEGLARRRRRIPARDRWGAAPPSWPSPPRRATSRSAAPTTVIRYSGAPCTRARSTRSRGSRARRAWPPRARTGRSASSSSAPTSRHQVVRPGRRWTSRRLEPQGRHAGGGKGTHRVHLRRPTASSAAPRGGEHDHRPRVVAGRRRHRVRVLRRRPPVRSQDGRPPAPPGCEGIDAEPGVEPRRQGGRVGLPGQQRARLAFPERRGHGAAGGAAEATRAQLQRRRPAAGDDRRARRDRVECRATKPGRRRPCGWSVRPAWRPR